MTVSTLPFSLEIADKSHAAELAALAERTFRQAFVGMIAPADTAVFCAEVYGEPQQLAELTDPLTHTLMARADGAAIGFCQLREGPHPPEVPPLPTAELKRLYVEKNWHGAGVAQALLAAALDLARARGAQAIWLSAWSENPRAFRFYQKCGFEQRGERVFIVGSDHQRDWLLWRRL